MEITDRALPWTSDDEAKWNAFLETLTGKRLVPKLAERMPTLLANGDTNSILIRNGETRGFQMAIAGLFELTHAQPLPVESETPAYPSLTDDKFWDDGQKITQ